MVVKLQIVNINKQRSILKVWYYKVPNASYTERCVQFRNEGTV